MGVGGPQPVNRTQAVPVSKTAQLGERDRLGEGSAFHGEFPGRQTPQSPPLTDKRDRQSERPQQKPKQEGEAAGLETHSCSEVLILGAP